MSRAKAMSQIVARIPLLSAMVFVVFLCHVANAQGPSITGLLVNGVPSNSGPVGSTLTIQGSGFGASIGFSMATVNGTPIAGAGATPISWSNTSVVGVIPQTASSGPVMVTVGGKASNAVAFSIGPVITGVSPPSAPVGQAVTIAGQGFGTSGGTVTFNGATASSGAWTDASIVATVPTTASAGPIVVTVSGVASNGFSFTPTPSISRLSQNYGGPGNTITISGNSFGTAAQPSVTFNGVAATVSSWTNTSIVVSVPAAGTTGSLVVSVNGLASAGVMFTYVPSIASLSPIPVLADGVITIAGSYFGAPLGTDKVTFNGVAAAINSWSDTSIAAVVPPNVTTGNVVVLVNGISSNPYSFSLRSPYSFSVSYAPNGDVLSLNDNINGNWVYSYDDFNRLICSNQSNNGTCASPTNGTPTYTYAYDQYGNRWQQNGPYTMLLTFTNTRNQMDGYSYDAAGNLLNDGNHKYVYDAENRLIQVDPGPTGQPAAYAYAYDGDGQRIQKQGSGVIVAEYFHDLSGNTVTEINGSGVWTRGEVYAGARHVATYSGGAKGSTFFVQQDWLGTERARVLPNGDLSETCVSLPFGDGQTCNGSADPTPDHFTGKERDSESGLDYFGARYDASSMGRFMTPDPLPWPHWQNGSKAERRHFPEFLINPQNFNMYSYVRNNPLNSVDPDGLLVYVVVYTTGNPAGDEQLKRAAQTKKDEITSSKGFDAKKDTVILAGVKTKAEFQNVLNSAAKIADQFGKTTSVSLFSRAGDISGPVFHGEPAGHTQFTESELQNLKVNWGANSTATFYGCRTAHNFAQDFANAQNVRSFGFLGGVNFSADPSNVGIWGKRYLVNGQFDLYMVDQGEKGLQERDPE